MLSLCRSEISDSISDKERQSRRKVAHHFGNAKRSFASRSSPSSEPDSHSEDEGLGRVDSSSSSSSSHVSSGTTALQNRHSAVNSHPVYSSEEEEEDDSL